MMADKGDLGVCFGSDGYQIASYPGTALKRFIEKQIKCNLD